MMDDVRRFQCRTCHHEWQEPFGTGRQDHCPSCRSIDFYRTTQGRNEKRE
jgi:Zn finger protein HypA/HybF involved in hydrogenase expression